MPKSIPTTTDIDLLMKRMRDSFDAKDLSDSGDPDLAKVISEKGDPTEYFRLRRVRIEALVIVLESYGSITSFFKDACVLTMLSSANLFDRTHMGQTMAFAMVAKEFTEKSGPAPAALSTFERAVTGLDEKNGEECQCENCKKERGE